MKISNNTIIFGNNHRQSSTKKERYNKKAYEDIRLRVKKGQKEKIQARADELQKSINGYIVDLIEDDLKKR